MDMAIMQHFQYLRRFHQSRKHQHYQWVGVSMHQRRSRRPLLERHADDLPAIVSRQTGITLREIKAALAARGIAVKALSTIADMLHRLGLSHKKTRMAKL